MTAEKDALREDVISALLAVRLKTRGLNPALVTEPDFRDHMSDAADEVLSVVREALGPVRALHVPWYESSGVRHDFTVISYGPDNLPEGHDCETAGCLDRDDPESTEHQVLACSECRGSNPEYDDLTCHPFWPCPTIRAIDRVFPPGQTP